MRAVAQVNRAMSLLYVGFSTSLPACPVSSIDYSELVPATPPPASLGYRPELLEAVYRAEQILTEHGAVGDAQLYPQRHLARWRSQRLITLLVRLEHRERWELRERTWREGDGWRWSVQRVAIMTPNGESNVRAIRRAADR